MDDLNIQEENLHRNKERGEKSLGNRKNNKQTGEIWGDEKNQTNEYLKNRLVEFSNIIDGRGRRETEREVDEIKI